ncbi:MAG: PAQR family membrane homeostasis protein TrhA [Planctomycetaceae bacterium]
MLEPTASILLDQPLSDSPREQPLLDAESANQLTHGLGFLLSLVAAGVMIQAVSQQADVWQVVSCLIYVASLVALYAASTLSHSFTDPARRAFYRTLDQVCIFLLLAGSYTPFGITHLRSGPWGLILVVMWLLVAIGIWLRVTRGDGAVPFVFFAMIGWLPGLALGHIYSLSGLHGLGLVLSGGLAYTVGLWFLTNDHRHRYLHAVWHLFTIAGSACHFLFLQWYVAEWPLA